MIKISNTKSQSEVITTVLLVLISIAAVVLVSTFIINMVRNNLKGTECFQTAGQLEIKTDEGFTFYNSSDESVYLSIKRGIKEFNLSGIIVVAGDERNSDTKRIIAGTTTSGIFFYNSSGAWSNLSIPVPQAGQTRAYKLNVSSSGIAVSKVTIYPMLKEGSECDMADEKIISTVTS